MKKILLVEDDNFLIDIYTKQLTMEGYNVCVATDGDLAINKIKEESFDLVILDIILPRISGWEILKKIREELKMNDLKVIILSALSLKDEAEKLSSLNVLKYLSKTDNTPKQIAEEIKKIIN